MKPEPAPQLEVVLPGILSILAKGPLAVALLAGLLASLAILALIVLWWGAIVG
jgi:hypothetical protein